MSSQMESIRRALRVHGARSTIPVVVQKVNLSLFLIRSVNPLFFILFGILHLRHLIYQHLRWLASN